MRPNERPKLWQRRAFGEADRGMVLGQGADPGTRMIRQSAKPGGPGRSIGAQHLAPGIENEVAAVPADDCGGCSQGDGIPVGCPELDLLGVVEDVHTGSHLVQRSPSQQRRSRCRSTTA